MKKLAFVIALLCSSTMGAPIAKSTAIVRAQFGAQADFYVCYVSRTSGKYTNSYSSQVPQFQISGLTQGATYYFAVSAFYRAKETPKSAEVSKLVPYSSPKYQ